MPTLIRRGEIGEVCKKHDSDATYADNTPPLTESVALERRTLLRSDADRSNSVPLQRDLQYTFPEFVRHVLLRYDTLRGDVPAHSPTPRDAQCVNLICSSLSYDIGKGSGTRDAQGCLLQRARNWLFAMLLLHLATGWRCLRTAGQKKPKRGCRYTDKFQQLHAHRRTNPEPSTASVYTATLTKTPRGRRDEDIDEDVDEDNAGSRWR